MISIPLSWSHFAAGEAIAKSSDSAGLCFCVKLWNIILILNLGIPLGYILFGSMGHLDPKNIFEGESRFSAILIFAIYW